MKVIIVFLNHSTFGNNIPNFETELLKELPKKGETISFEKGLLIDSNEESLPFSEFKVSKIIRHFKNKNELVYGIYLS